jgi:hypothetical protein
MPVAPFTISPFTFKPIIPWVSDPIKETRRRRPGKKIRKGVAPTQKLEQIRKQFLADIASVTASQALYGRATHLALTPQAWAEAEKTGYAVVPTVELQQRGRRTLAEATERELAPLPKRPRQRVSLTEGIGLGKPVSEVALPPELRKKKKKKKDEFDIDFGGL